LEFVDDLNCSTYVQGKWSKCRLNVDFTFLAYLIFRYDVQVGETLVHERGHVSSLL
jgi:hypothetical protein